MTARGFRGDGRNADDEGDERLTSIRGAYTLAATPEAGNERDEVMVRHFLETLAEVALSVASRKEAGDTEVEG